MLICSRALVCEIALGGCDLASITPAIGVAARFKGRCPDLATWFVTVLYRRQEARWAPTCNVCSASATMRLSAASGSRRRQFRGTAAISMLPHTRHPPSISSIASDTILNHDQSDFQCWRRLHQQRPVGRYAPHTRFSPPIIPDACWLISAIGTPMLAHKARPHGA